MRLWLDDERPAPEGWTHVKTASEAIALLESGVVSEISLDHDLGPPMFGTGYDVASKIEELAYFDRIGPLRWSIHSANPVGRARMQQAMEHADFYWLV